jgi:hypothetical protein
MPALQGASELMMLLLSVVLGIVPLLGVAWIVLKASVTTVDGLFMSLILLTLSGILFLNAYLDVRGRLKKSTTAEKAR